MSLVLSTKEDATLARLLAHSQAVRDNWHSVVYMKEALAEEDSLKFREAWDELSREDQVALWVAPSRGGIWTTAERTQMRGYMNVTSN